MPNSCAVHCGAECQAECHRRHPLLAPTAKKATTDVVENQRRVLVWAVAQVTLNWTLSDTEYYCKG